MKLFLSAAESNEDYRRLSDYLKTNNPLPALVTGVSHIHKAHLLAALLCGEDIKHPALIIADSEAEAAKLCADINILTGEQTALLLPEKEFVLTGADAASRDYEHRRLFALSAMLGGECRAAVCSPEAAAQLTIPPKELQSRTVTLSLDAEVSQSELVSRLVAAGYSRADMVEGAGQFSVRGGILDVFPPSAEKPFRIELWGDTVDSLSEFDPESQRRTRSVEMIRISPARETLFNSPEELAEKIEALCAKLRGKRAAELRERLRADAQRLRGGSLPSGFDRFFPLCYEENASAFDYAGAVFVCEYAAVKESYRAAFSRHEEELSQLSDECAICKGIDTFALNRGELQSSIESRCRAYFDAFIRGGGLQLGANISVAGAVQTSPWSGEYKLLEEELRGYLKQGYACVIFAGTDKGAANLSGDLREDGFKAICEKSPEKPSEGIVTVVPGTLSSGFEYTRQRFVVFTHTAVHAERRRAPKRRKSEEIRSLEDIAIGDLVVHYSHGIGIFDGVRKIEAGGVEKDYIRIKYAGTDVLYVPVTQLDMVSRYIGAGDVSTVKLNKLNSERWQHSKEKAKAAAREMAAEYIELYSRRMKAEGFAFPTDDDLQEDFEQHFPYVETDSQLRCVEEIKADMQRGNPMERLLCGDVGFGKTEVALRAAFKCIEAGKQCAILAPTTVLAWQHYQTATMRMEGFPVNVALMSRYKTASEQRETLAKLASGRVDLLIGTHRIIQKDVVFKDLGLVIIDEEQRFGVAHKDKFKQMFEGVDILSLSATPIPRTLNMAMSGIRDMSVLDEPPQDRQPVSTYVMEQDFGVIASAIKKELRRNGQVYYIHNRIDSIYECAAKIGQLVPEARIGVAHGRMDEREILEAWRGLLDGEIDILVCTTIIETGVDVPNVNTLIIEDSDRMGLAQLHQLRGRVGRTNKRAYAYFMFTPGKVLTEIAQRRLDAVREFTQFGSGFRIAMRDLEIRGAGSILGANQSGHLANIGYDLYLKLLDEAVREERGEQNVRRNDCVVDLQINAYIPENYISNQAQRVDCYRKIARIHSDEDREDVLDELIDRYGDPPPSVVGLVDTARYRSLAADAGIEEITQSGGNMVFYLARFDMERVQAASKAVRERFGKARALRLETLGRPRLTLPATDTDDPLELMKIVATAMSDHR